MKKLKANKVLITLIAALFIVLISYSNIVSAQAPSVLKIGSSNGDVWDLQYRLNQLDYPVAIDGIYGYQTSSAVKKFQTNYGVINDGIVGPVTWRVVKKTSLSKNDFQLFTHLIYSEARGEPYQGQVAVGAVVLNRIDSEKFPNTLRDVIFQKDAFTAVNDGQFWLTPNKTAETAALDAVRGWDPSQGALFYFNPNTATSAWIWSRPQILKIGNHIFTV